MDSEAVLHDGRMRSRGDTNDKAASIVALHVIHCELNLSVTAATGSTVVGLRTTACLRVECPALDQKGDLVHVSMRARVALRCLVCALTCSQRRDIGKLCLAEVCIAFFIVGASLRSEQCPAILELMRPVIL